MVVQLPAPCGRAQCLATLQSPRAPAPSPGSCLGADIPSPSGHCQPLLPHCLRALWTVLRNSQENQAAHRGGGAKNADIWARARPTYRIIPVYIRQLFILTWCAAGAGQKRHRALQHLPPAPLPRAAGSTSQHLRRLLAAAPREPGPPPYPWLTPGAGSSLCDTHLFIRHQHVGATSPSWPSEGLLQNTLRELSFWLWEGKASCWCSNISFGSILKITEGFLLYYAQIAQWAQFLEQVLKEK